MQCLLLCSCIHALLRSSKQHHGAAALYVSIAHSGRRPVCYECALVVKIQEAVAHFLTVETATFSLIKTIRVAL
jgi:hypothetical protein